MGTEAASEKGPIGLLLVHGIGCQEPGDTERKLVAGLKRASQAVSLTDDGRVLIIDGQAVRCYEVYWADLLKGEITVGAFQMKELQSLSWFPLMNWWRGNYRGKHFSSLKLAWWCVALPLINFLVLFAYYGAGWIFRIVSDVIDKGDEAERDGAGTHSVIHAANRSVKRSELDRLLDEYLGDIFSYVNSAGRAFYREQDEPAVPAKVLDVYTEVLRRFYDQLVKAHADGCTTIQVVAHSLGTVVTYHALAGLRFDVCGREQTDKILTASRKVRHVYTIGSPLEKIRFFWPRLIVEGGLLRGNKVQWDNFVSWFDPVAGMLRGFSHWGELHNHRLLGGGFIRGHVVYEHSPVFLKSLIQGLLGRELPFTPSGKEWWSDWFMLAGETLVTPVALTVVLTVDPINEVAS